jgi:hypothetical protein
LNFYDYLKSAWLNKNFRNGFNGLLLAVIPLIYSIVWFLFNDSVDSYFYTMMDPEYSYLLNGVVAIENNGNVDFFDHPGTTIEIFNAGTIRLIHMFREDPIIDDVLKNPELYLNAINNVLGVLLIGLLVFGGIFVLRKTGNPGLALLVQATPLLFNIPNFMARVIPESLAILFILILIILIIAYIESKKEMHAGNTYTILFSVTIAVILATKISMLPLFFIPLLLLNKGKKRLLYCGLIVLFFLLAAYPVLLHLNRFFQWIKLLFLHSGQYGSGEANFISVQDFIRNLNILYDSYRLVFYLLFANLTIMAGGILLKRKKTLPFPTEKYNAIVGLTLCYVLQIIMISKHFGLHYFLPSLMLVTMNVYLIIAFLLSFRRLKYARMIESSLYLVVVIAILFYMFHYVKTDTRIRYESMHKREKTTHFIHAGLPESPVVFHSESWNPRQDMAIWFGSVFTNKCRYIFVNKMNEIYPNRYFYADYYGCYLDWFNNHYELNEIVDKHDSVVFIYNRISESAAAFLTRSNQCNSFTVDTLYNYPERSENITMLKKIK